MIVRVTRHAEHRMRERLGINKTSVLAAAQRAFDRGAEYQDTSGKLRHFLDEKIICYGSQSVYRIYSEFLYVFSVDGFLITIVPLYCQMTKCVKRKGGQHNARSVDMGDRLDADDRDAVADFYSGRAEQEPSGRGD